MNLTEKQLEAQVERFGRHRRDAIGKALAAIGTPHVSRRLALAIGSRETNLQNIVGDGGHGRGVFQQDDRFQREFLVRARGCPSGSYRARFSSALPAGRVPTLSAGTQRMAEIIESNVAFAIRSGIPKGRRLRFAVAAYNAGAGGALKGWHEAHDVDRHTAGHNYSHDVFQRWAVLKEMDL
jgi:hypothetical protein